MIRSFDCKEYFNDTFNEKCIEIIDDMLQYSICCYRFPDCEHPTIQSHNSLLNENNEYF